MITKFKSSTDDAASIEFERQSDTLSITINHKSNPNPETVVHLNAEQLFSLIGHLLTIQSIFKRLTKKTD